LPPACGSQAAAKPAVATPSAVIELRALNLAFGNRTLFHDFNWRVLAGERWVILGPNGSGKTTLLSLISGDNPRAYAHDIRLFGRPRRVGENLWALRQRIGSLSPEMQRFLDPGLPLLQLVLSGRINRSGIVCRPVAAARQHALELLSRFGLRHEAATPCGALTDGQQRLGLIARALHARPRLLLLDEPCFNLDRESRHLVLTAITQLLQAEPALTAICVAHRPDDIPAGFDHLLRLGGEASGDSG
jgi:molybdate transport system ATP-binding protein